jgi:hypothetical protein
VEEGLEVVGDFLEEVEGVSEEAEVVEDLMLMLILIISGLSLCPLLYNVNVLLSYIFLNLLGKNITTYSLPVFSKLFWSLH